MERLKRGSGRGTYIVVSIKINKSLGNTSTIGNYPQLHGDLSRIGTKEDNAG